MKDAALYEHLLGLKDPWSVKKMDLCLADQRVVVEVVLKKSQVWGDPTDATKRAHINGWTERQWRHLDICQFETIIKARIHQLKFSDGTVEELKVPWAERYSRVTTLMAAFVIKLLEAVPAPKRSASSFVVPGKDTVSLWQVEFSYGLKNHSGFNEAPVKTDQWCGSRGIP
jgi:transposase